jgi:hypothetical protein
MPGEVRHRRAEGVRGDVALALPRGVTSPITSV